MRKVLLYTMGWFAGYLLGQGYWAALWMVAAALILWIRAVLAGRTQWPRSLWLVCGLATGLAVQTLHPAAEMGTGVTVRQAQILGVAQGLVTGNANSRKVRLTDGAGRSWVASWTRFARGGDPIVRAGDRLFGVGRQDQAAPPANPFEFDFQAFQAGRGLAGSVRLGNWVCRPGAGQVPWSDGVWAQVGAVRDGVDERLQNLEVSDTYVAILRALVLGDSGAIPKENRSLYSATGTAHLFSVSGLHLSTVGQLFWWILAAIGGLVPDRSGTGRRQRFVSLLVLAGGTAYLLVTGAPVSCLRAFVMLVGQVLAQLFEKEYDAWTWLSLSALVLAACRPEAMQEASFQLSVACVAAMLLAGELSRDWREQTGESGLKHPVVGPLWDSAKTSWASSLVTLPMVWRQFGGIPAWPVPANMVAVPLVSYLIFPLGLVASFAPCPTAIARVLGWATEVLLDLLDSWLQGVVWLGGTLRWAWPGWASASLISGLLFVASFRGSVRLRGLLVCVAIGIALIAIPASNHLGGPQWKWVFFHAEEADMALLRTESGATMLVDAGRKGAGAQVLLPYLWYHGITRLDVVVITHAHDDHYGGMGEVASQIEVCEYWVADLTAAVGIAQGLTQVGAGCGGPPRVRTWQAGQNLAWAGAQWHVWWPGPELGKVGQNDSSLVLTAQFPEATILLPGDLEGKVAGAPIELLARALAAWVGPSGERGTPLVVKAPHHAHKSPMLRYLTQWICPEVYFLPSVGELVEWRAFWWTGGLKPPPLVWLSGERGAMEAWGNDGEFSVKVSTE